MELEQRAPSLVPAIIIAAGTALFDHGNSRARRQFPHRCWKIEMLVIHHKTKNTPPDSAAEAMKSLPLRANRKRRCLFLMKWAERLEVRAGAFERKI